MSCGGFFLCGVAISTQINTPHTHTCCLSVIRVDCLSLNGLLSGPSFHRVWMCVCVCIVLVVCLALVPFLQVFHSSSRCITYSSVRMRWRWNWGAQTSFSFLQVSRAHTHTVAVVVMQNSLHINKLISIRFITGHFTRYTLQPRITPTSFHSFSFTHIRKTLYLINIYTGIVCCYGLLYEM